MERAFNTKRRKWGSSEMEMHGIETTSALLDYAGNIGNKSEQRAMEVKATGFNNSSNGQR